MIDKVSEFGGEIVLIILNTTYEIVRAGLFILVLVDLYRGHLIGRMIA